MRDTGTAIRTIIGHDSPLDLEYRKFQNAQLPMESISFAPSPLHGQDNLYIELVGDWMISVTLDPGITALIESFFSSGEKRFEGSWFNDAAAQLRAERRTCRLRVERGTAQSRKIKKLFAEYWDK